MTGLSVMSTSGLLPFHQSQLINIPEKSGYCSIAILIELIMRSQFLALHILIFLLFLAVI